MSSTHRSNRPRLAKLLSTLLATTAMLSATGVGPAAQAQPYVPDNSVRDVVADEAGYGGQVALAVGGSRILRFRQPIGQVMVGNPKVGDVIPLGERTLYVMGKASGATNLTVMPRVGSTPLATLDMRVGYDVDNARRAMREVLPGEQLDVSARGDGLVLTGTLSSSAGIARAAALAEQYAPGHVVNLMSVRGAEQVMLSVRVAEVQRTALQQLGLNNINALWDKTGSLTFAAPILNSDAVVNLIGRSTSGDWTFQTLFDALERKGFASTLAEPNLVALSGETAVFFAGGEFPIPVPQTGAGVNNTITIEYKQYGVSIGFTPTVYGDTINLAVAPEVSALDPANSIVLQGFRIPGITTRRAKTTVELRNGQSFAIAGLIRREFSDNMRGIPGASRVPIFGALMRSTGYQNNETEVVIIVTAHLAKPTDKRNLLAPTDLRQGPSEADLYLTGATDRAIPASRPTASLQGAPSTTQPSAPAASPAMAAAPATPAAPAPAQPAPMQTATAPAPTPQARTATASMPPAPVAASPVVAAAHVTPMAAPAQPAPMQTATAAPKPAPSAPAPVVAAAPAAPMRPAPAAQPAPVQAATTPKPAAAPAVPVSMPAKPVAPAPVIAAAPASPAKPAVAPAPATVATAPKPVPVSMVALAAPSAKPEAATPAEPVQPVKPVQVNTSLVVSRTLVTPFATEFTARSPTFSASGDR